MNHARSEMIPRFRALIQSRETVRPTLWSPGLMKRILYLTLAIALSSHVMSYAESAEDIQRHPFCKYCGMNRSQYSHSRMLIEYDDGSSFGSCSIHCSAIDLAVKMDGAPVSLMVGDYSNGKLIEAELAHWVIGGSKPGVMTRRAKWAFGKRKDAERFIRTYGGRISTFDEAMKATYEDMYTDSKMIRSKRKIRQMQK